MSKPTTAPAGRKRPSAKPVRRRQGVMGSVLKTFEVLDVFGREWRPLSVAELCRETGQPKSSLHRVLSTLVQADVLEQNAQGLYHLTLKLWRIGALALTEIDVLRVARPHLEALSKAADETVHLAILEHDNGVIYLSKVESPRSIRVQTQVGKVSPSWCTATGRALLAFDPTARDGMLATAKRKFTPATVTDSKRLRHILDEVAKVGFAVTKGENNPEMGGIAAPIRDHSGKVVASCGVAIPAFRMDESLIKRCTELVLKTSADISEGLGYRRSGDVANPKIKARVSR